MAKQSFIHTYNFGTVVTGRDRCARSKLRRAEAVQRVTPRGRNGSCTKFKIELGTKRKREGGALHTAGDMGRKIKLQHFRAHYAWILTGDRRSSNRETRMIILGYGILLFCLWLHICWLEDADAFLQREPDTGLLGEPHAVTSRDVSFRRTPSKAYAARFLAFTAHVPRGETNATSQSVIEAEPASTLTIQFVADSERGREHRAFPYNSNKTKMIRARGGWV